MIYNPSKITEHDWLKSLYFIHNIKARSTVCFEKKCPDCYVEWKDELEVKL